MRLIVLSIGLVGCAAVGETATPPGQLGLCVDGPGVERSSQVTWAFSGTVESLGGPLERGSVEVDGCTWIDGGASMVLVDDADERWTIGWVATAGSGDEEQERTPTLDVAVGDALDVEIRAWFDWAEEIDLMVRDEAGPVFAAATGYYAEVWNEVVSGAPLTVTRGEATRAAHDDGCGKRSANELVFDADNRVTLDVWEQGALKMDGVRLQARNVGAWAFDGVVECTDTWGPMPWMAYR